jgi:hypothetical protein
MLRSDMELVSVSPLRAGFVVWQKRPGEWQVTVHCRATYELEPGESRLAAKQEEPHETDCHWEGDPARSLYAPGDVAPAKARADVILVGSAYAPGGIPVSSLVTRLCVAGIDKSIEVFGRRAITQDGALQEGAPFDRMPLAYEVAAGGPGTPNPVGVRLDERDAYGRILLPSVQAKGLALSGPDVRMEPIGFGPLSPTWPERVEKLGRHAAAWSHYDWHERPLPEDLDLAYFNVAPRDQQVTTLREDEQLLLENLSPKHPRLSTKLPGIRPVVFFEAGPSTTRIHMRADTLWIDVDRASCALTFRGQLPLERRDGDWHVVVAMETPGQTLGWAEVERMMPLRPKARPRIETMAIPARGPDESTKLQVLVPVQGAALPFAAGGSAAPTPPTERPSSARGDGALPFSVPPQSAARGARVGAWPSVTPMVAASAAPAKAWTEPEPTPPGGRRHQGTAPPPPSPAAVPVLPPPVPPPVGSSPGVRAVPSPWAGGPGIDAPAASARGPMDPPAVLPVRPHAVALGEYAARAAAVPARAPARAPEAIPLQPTGPSEVFLLLWFDPESVPRVRRTKAYKPLLDALEHRPVDRELDDAAQTDDPMELEDRREVFEILARGTATDASGVRRTVHGAMRKDGKFVPQLVLLRGELDTPFDEIERLKATITTVKPLIRPEEESLKTAVEQASDFIGMPNFLCPGSVADGFTRRIREEFKAEGRSLPEAYLEEETDRVLLEKRHYQKRIVFGEPHLRTLLLLPTDDMPLPTYLPESLTNKLPMFRRFKVRLLAEAQLKEDQYETHDCALRVVALVRVAAPPAGES